MQQQSGEGAWHTGRRTLLAAVASVTLVASLTLSLTLPGPAAAQTDPPATPAGEDEPIEVPEPVPGQEVCTVTDSRLVELSGLVATDDGYIVINDSQLPGFESRLPIFFLDQACQVVDELSFLPGRPRDPEDLELDYETGTLWVGDFGDNAAGGTGQGDVRENVGLWRVDLTGGDPTPVIHRFTYPDGQAHDAEALLLDADGIPIIITKAALGPTEVFQPTELRPSESPEDTVSLEKVGEVKLPDTETEHPLAAVARRVVTGGSVAPDRSRVVIRTYTDAFEFDVTDGDVVGAITTGRPRVTPLPGEPRGESITYSPDGQEFLTVSDAPEDQVGEFVPVILRYTPTPPAPEPPADEAPPPAGSQQSGFSLLNSVQDILNTVAAVGLFGLLLVIVGVIGIVRSRRRPPRGQADRRNDAERRADQSAHGGGERDEPAGSPAVGRARPGAGTRTGAGAAVGGAAGAAAVAGAATAGVATGGVATAVATARPGVGAARPDPARPGPTRSDPARSDLEPGWEPGWEPDLPAAGRNAGVYTSRAAGHADPGHAEAGSPGYEQQAEYGYQQAGYAQPEHRRAGYDRARYEQAGYEQAGYAEPEYDDAGYDDAGHAQAGYAQAGYAQAGYEQGYDGHRSGGYDNGYQRGSYPDQPYDQDWSGDHDPRRPDPRHPGDAYPEAGHREAGLQANQDGGYESDDAYDDYSEDPDYHYEFRDRGRW